MNLERAAQGWAKALEGHPFVSVDDLISEIEQGAAVCISGERSDVFARIDRGVLEMGPVAGDLRELLEMLPRIEAWARANGATEVHVQAGRGEWEHVLSPRGYEVAAVILRKKFDGPV